MRNETILSFMEVAKQRYVHENSLSLSPRMFKFCTGINSSIIYLYLIISCGISVDILAVINYEEDSAMTTIMVANDPRTY